MQFRENPSGIPKRRSGAYADHPRTCSTLPAIFLYCNALQNCYLCNVHHFFAVSLSVSCLLCFLLAVRCFGPCQGDVYCARDASSATSGGWSVFSRIYCCNAFAVGWSHASYTPFNLTKSVLNASNGPFLM